MRRSDGSACPHQLLDQHRDFTPRFEMRHVADAGESMERYESAQALGVMSRNDPILESEHDFGRRLRRREMAADVDRLSAVRKQGCGQSPLLGDQRTLLAP